MKCPFCNSEMKTVMHFEKGRDYTRHECTRCKSQTHPKRIHYEDFVKEEKHNKTNE